MSYSILHLAESLLGYRQLAGEISKEKLLQMHDLTESMQRLTFENCDFRSRLQISELKRTELAKDLDSKSQRIELDCRETADRFVKSGKAITEQHEQWQVSFYSFYL